MLEKHAPSDQIISNCLHTHYGIKTSSLTSLALGADINASKYKALALNQTSYFIKVKHGHHHDTAVEIVELLQRSGIEEIIPSILTIHGKPMQLIDNSTLIMYPFIEGQDGFHRNLTEDQWTTLGKALKQIHEVKVPLPILNRIRKETYSAKWRDALCLIYPHVESNLISDEIGLNLQKFIKKNISDIRQLVDRSEELGEKLRRESLPFVLCHSDIHAGNVLMDENSHIYIVDWDEPIMAPKERDLMFIGGGVGNVWNNPIEEQLFYKGYGKTEINWTALAYYRHERIVEDIAIYSQEVLLGSGKEEERLEMYQHFLAMFEPHGVVNIAFKTDQ
ncbi:MAG: aminoglycoside phosphotransferase family protein [Chlamydiae bacterium]|nr:aminoglycoside phosphotransferase family protein [Chlamydiota bacterium]